VSNKIPGGFFVKIHKFIVKLKWKYKGSKKSKTIFGGKELT
jgi:hypothetical protein